MVFESRVPARPAAKLHKFAVSDQQALDTPQPGPQVTAGSPNDRAQHPSQDDLSLS